jgi:hypothetical protein
MKVNEKTSEILDNIKSIVIDKDNSKTWVAMYTYLSTKEFDDLSELIKSEVLQEVNLLINNWYSSQLYTPSIWLRLKADMRLILCKRLLCYNDNGDEFLFQITKNEYLYNIQIIDLENCRITEQGVRLLIDSTVFKDINEVILSSNNISGTAAVLLFSSPLFENTYYMNLSNNNIESLKELKDQRYVIKNLTRLLFGNNHLTSIDMKYLSDSQILQNVKYLDLSENSIDDQGLIHLVNSSYLNNLETLIITECDLEDQSIIQLAVSDNVPKLTCIDIQGNYYTEIAEKELINAGFHYDEGNQYWIK